MSVPGTPPAHVRWAPAAWVGRWAAYVIWSLAILVFVVGSWLPHWHVDEAFTVVIGRSSWSDAWRMSAKDAALGPYYLALKPWEALSSSHLWVRLPSVLAAAFCVAILFVLVRRAAGSRVAGFAAILLIVVPAMSRYAGFARPYALASLGCLITVACWWHFVDRGRTSAAVGMVVGLVLTGMAHTYALLIGVPLVIAAVVAPLHSRGTDLRRTLVPGGFAIVLLAPWLRYVLTHARGTPDARRATPSNVLDAFVRLPVSGGAGRLALAAGILLVLLGVAGCTVGWTDGGSRRTLAVLAASWWILPPCLLAVWQIASGHPGVVGRYWFFCVPALAICSGLALDRLAVRHLALAVAVLLGLTAITLPTHRAIRQPNAWGGLAYVDLMAVLDLPQLRTAPLLIREPHYRALLANDPGAASRIPYLDSGAGGPRDRLPGFRGASSRTWQDTVRTAETIVLLKGVHRPARLGQRVTKGMLKGQQRGALQVYSAPDVLCVFHGELLGVLSRDDQVMAPVEASALAKDIEDIRPSKISCRAPEAAVKPAGKDPQRPADGAAGPQGRARWARTPANRASSRRVPSRGAAARLRIER